MIFKRPLIFFAIAMYIGGLSFSLYRNNVFLGAVFSASFLAIMIFTLEKKYFFIVALFFIIGYVNILGYYSVGLPKSLKAKMRLIDDRGYYKRASYNNKIVWLSGIYEHIDEGKIIYIECEKEDNVKIKEDAAARYKVNKILKTEEDLITETYKFKKSIYKKLCSEFGESNAALLISLCFGDKSNLSEETTEDMQKLGIMHVISVSGFHMAIVYRIFEFFIGMIPALIFSIGYAIITGLKAATVRALITIFIMKISKKVYRQYDALSSLAFSAIILLTVKPYYVVDIGFNLSYLACIGIILYYKKLRKALYRLPEFLNKGVSICLSAQCFAMPYSCLIFKKYSLFFLLGNIILIPILSCVIVLGILLILFFYIKPIKYVISLCLKVLFIILEGVNYLITKNVPPLIEMDYRVVVLLLCIYVTFIFLKHSIRKMKFIPLFLVIFFLMNDYVLFPEVTYIITNDGNSYVVKHGFSAVMVTDYDANYSKEILQYISLYKTEKIINIKENENIYFVRDNLIFKLNEESNYNNFKSNEEYVIISLPYGQENKNGVFKLINRRLVRINKE